jgi:hypothetical protein
VEGSLWASNESSVLPRITYNVLCPFLGEAALSIMFQAYSSHLPKSQNFGTHPWAEHFDSDLDSR